MKRRSNGEGSLFHNKKRNVYELRITYIDDNGIKKRKAFYAPTAKEVKIKRDKWQKEYVKPDNTLYENPLVKDWIDEWLETYVKTTVKPSTYEKYKGCVQPIKEQFGSKHLNDLDPTILQRFFNKQLKSGGKKENGLSTLTVRNQRRYFSSCIDAAIRVELTTKNPVKLTKPPKIIKSEIHPLSIEESQNILNLAIQNINIAHENQNIGEEMSASDLYIGVYIALETGMRLGEIMALQWRDIINHEYILVQRSKSNVKGQNVTSTKTGVNRKIQITKKLAAALDQHLQLQKDYVKHTEGLYHHNSLIIGGVYGNGYNNRHFSSRKFQKLLKQANINRHIRFHDLRHTHATMLLLAGVNPKIVQERLGHSSIDMTLDTYSHLTLSNQSLAIDALDKINL